MASTTVGLAVAMIVSAGAGGAYVYRHKPHELPGFVAGVLTTSDGTPLPDVALDIKGRRSPGLILNLDDGTFKIALPGGRRTVTFSHRDYRDVSIDVRIEKGRTSRVEIVMLPRE